VTDSERPPTSSADESADAGRAAPASAQSLSPEDVRAGSEPDRAAPLLDRMASAAVRTMVPAASDPLRILPWIAVIGVTALVLGRFVAPSLPGTFVGMARTVRFVEVAGSALTQLFAASSIVGLAIALLGLANSTVPAFMRLLALSVSGWVSLMVVFGAITADRVAETPSLIGALFAGTFAVLAAIGARASPLARLPALILGLVGVSSIVRALHGFVSAEAAPLVNADALGSAGRAVATIATILVGLALLLALVQIGRSARAESEPQKPTQASLWSPASIVVLVLAVVCARQAAVGAGSDAGLASVLLKRAADRFLTQPAPHLSHAARLFLGFLTPLTAAALLFVRRMRGLTAAVALTIVAADISSAPLGAIALVLASLAVLLFARSGHVLWSALIARPPSSPPVQR